MDNSGAYTLAPGAIIGIMTNDLLDSTGARIMWARKRRDWTQKTLGLRVGVRSVYISQIESGSRRASRALIAKIARELGVSIGFLELETDEPTPPKADAVPEPNYWHAETDELARIADALPPWRRRELLALAQTMAETAEDMAPVAGEMTRLTAADVDALAAADDTGSRTLAGIAAARREVARLTRSLQDADDDRYVHGTLDAERHARTVARLRAEIDNQGAEIGRLEAAQRREAESGTRRERLLDVLQNGAAILENADPTLANAWLRTHLRIWSDGAALLVDWSLDWRPV